MNVIVNKEQKNQNKTVRILFSSLCDCNGMSALQKKRGARKREDKDTDSEDREVTERIGGGGVTVCDWRTEVFVTVL